MIVAGGVSLGSSGVQRQGGKEILEKVAGRNWCGDEIASGKGPSSESSMNESLQP